MKILIFTTIRTEIFINKIILLESICDKILNEVSCDTLFHLKKIFGGGSAFIHIYKYFNRKPTF